MMNFFNKHFSRKKQDKRKSLGQAQTSISADNSPLHRERPTSQCLNIAPRTSAYDDGKKEVPKEWECGLCKKQLVEPRVLGCLHSFCTRCLQGLHQEGEAEVWSEVDGGSIHLEQREHSGGGSAGSGYESDPRNSGSDGSWEKQHKYGIFTRKISGKSVQFLLCPSCGYETPLPLAGVSALPLNYVLMRKMAIEEEIASVLCDLCNSDNKAESRCNQCLVSVCTSCEEAHRRQKATARHSLQPLDPLPAKFCNQHPRAELTVYCATCQQVVCRDCCIISHSGHALANASRSAAERARLLRDACERAKHIPENVQAAARILNAQAFDQDSQAARVESEVQTWAEDYRRAVEAHTRALCTAAARARARYRQKVEEKNRELEDRSAQAAEAIKFAEELLSEGRDDEVLSLSGPALRRLQQLGERAPAAPRLSLRLAPAAPAQPPLVGRLLTAAPDPDQCLLNTEGLQDLRVDCRHDTIFELRDSSGERIWCGGEQVAGYFRRQDSSARPDFARVKDLGDGTYEISFTPSSPGAYLLAVTLDNKPIKGSPFACAARAAAAHWGRFHCCALCSSAGRAGCACGGSVPGGYKGCGHGHAGWPGSRHWSCCGATCRSAPCGKPRTHRHTSALYQFSL
ncbi:E3 ubiquitin-protein ligase TRIM45 isoform X2 [Amyelois transitella]|uniref:E3 ubiquitin-protein ligase TRIM45 isoform X2 n=1 Tax=Amyelois transitella TaxID=680683 RepID=UPI00298FDAA5|nr:E3 ubiquitin-protein ligase TRIM45 isoform X2 [Amyelois transitella]